MYRFSARGHPNITARHQNTFEFTKDAEVTLAGDCIIGVSADYDLMKCKKLSGKVKMTITAGDTMDTVHFTVHDGFVNAKEMVIRRTRFTCRRTFGIEADKTAYDLNLELKKAMQDPQHTIKVTLEPWDGNN